MGRKQTSIGLLFRQKFGYYGKLSRAAMGKELWNEYYKMLSKAKTNSDEHIKAIAERKAEKHMLALERQQHRKDVGEYLKAYCCDDFTKIENYEAAKAEKFVNWQCHHRLETHTSDGERRSVDITWRELEALGMYWKRPASELILMKRRDHRRLHLCGKPNCRAGKYKM